ncbi:tetratricopeptide repeat protein [Thermotoga caldifontis]|uniref:tetratricopeptide repeat protein n=1 Tax=Thermotoga caldifontis TaxID=1508419 RepID=UPI000597D21A|nr:tetratricopeptide repeat protein [Thermotoga caldifontis]
MRYLICVFALLSTLVLASAMEYYNSALNAYVQKDYKNALEWFETALKLDPSIESYDPLLKLRMGLCAFALKDYAKARAYLEPYESSNVVAANVLKAIREGTERSEEWMEWLRSRIPPPGPVQVQVTKKRSPVLLAVGVFVISFALSFLLLRMLRRKRPVEQEQPTVEEKLERQLEEIGMVSNSLKEGKTVIDFETDEELQKLEAQIESIVQEIISREGQKEEAEVSIGEDPFAILKKMEEKDQYSEEDAKILSQIMQQLVNNPEDSTDDSDERKQS